MYGAPRNYESQPNREYVRDSRTGKLHPNLAYRGSKGKEAGATSSGLGRPKSLRQQPTLEEIEQKLSPKTGKPLNNREIASELLADVVPPNKFLSRRSDTAKSREIAWATFRRLRNTALRGKDIQRHGERIVRERWEGHDPNDSPWQLNRSQRQDFEGYGTMKGALVHVVRTGSEERGQVGLVPPLRIAPEGIVIKDFGGRTTDMSYDPDEDVYRRSSDGATAKPTKNGKEVRDWKKLEWVGRDGSRAPRSNGNDLAKVGSLYDSFRDSFR